MDSPNPKPPLTKSAASRICACTTCAGRWPPACRAPACGSKVTEAALNHINGTRGGITGIYQRHSWLEEKRAALDAWGDYVAGIIEKRQPTGNIVALGVRKLS
jgi:hypothetical protein